MKIAELIAHLETIASPSLQEPYDNAGLICGDRSWECKGVICALDATEEVIMEAVEKGCNLVVAHHPIIFGGIKKLDSSHYVGRTLIRAIKHDIALYAIHTNLDNIIEGVNGKLADKLGLVQRKILAPKPGSLKKLVSFVPVAHAEKIKTALFGAGAGHIGNYTECSFSLDGEGSFLPGEGSDPFVGKKGSRHNEPEQRLEMIFPSHLEGKIVKALRHTHPYEEPAFDIYPLANAHPGIGAGLVGELEKPMEVHSFLGHLKKSLDLPFIRHTLPAKKEIKKVAICGGAGSFLIINALREGVDAYLTADLKYHEFFESNGAMLLADLGHFESEQFTIDLLADILQQKFHNFAVLKTAVRTNPVHYS